jgi:hypothetical protein
VSLGLTVLRFETAAVAALAVVRSALATLPRTIKGIRDATPAAVAAGMPSSSADDTDLEELGHAR